MRKLRSFGVDSDMVVTFYNAVICSISMPGSVCWGGKYFKIRQREVGKDCKTAGHVVGKPLDNFKTYTKRDCTEN